MLDIEGRYYWTIIGQISRQIHSPGWEPLDFSEADLASLGMDNHQDTRKPFRIRWRLPSFLKKRIARFYDFLGMPVLLIAFVFVLQNEVNAFLLHLLR